MHRSRPGRWVARTLVAALGLATLPRIASAHEVGVDRFESPVPFTLLLAGAGTTVALTALWLGSSARAGLTGRSSAADRHLLTVPSRAAAGLRMAGRAGFLAAFGLALVAGLVGPSAAAENLATVFTWPVWFRGLALVAIVAGSPWPVLSPWRTLYRGLTRLEGRDLALLGGVPDRLGHWPAVLGFLGLLGVLAPLTLVPRSPRPTVVVLACLALVILAGALLGGPAWFRRADPLGVFYRLFGRVAPVTLTDRPDGGVTLTLRPPWRGCRDPVADLSLVVFVVGMVYTVSFDGFANTGTYQTVLFEVRGALGTGSGTDVLLYAAGLVGFLVVFGLVVALVERLGAADEWGWRPAMRWFAPTVLPIAAAYEVAHNYPFVLRNAGRLVELLAAPVAPGLGPLDPVWWLSVPAFWASQVALIVGGHVVAAVAAHGVAVRRYEVRRAALRAHLPLVGLMVGYTVLSLWIVSQPVLAG